MNRCFVPSRWVEGQELELPADESKHLLQVLRTKIGESLTLVDGQGRVGQATLTRTEKQKAWVRISHVTESTNRSGIRVVFAVPKQAALDFIIHRCTEVGVRGFQPILTQHSLHPDSFNQERWQKVLREVCKQCEENFLPELADPISLDQYLAQRKGKPIVLCDESNRSAQSQFPTQDLDVLIGAEGGWDTSEIAQIQAAGALSLGLGKNRLRAETAALAALVLLKREIGEISGQIGVK